MHLGSLRQGVRDEWQRTRVQGEKGASEGMGSEALLRLVVGEQGPLSAIASAPQLKGC